MILADLTLLYPLRLAVFPVLAVVLAIAIYRRSLRSGWLSFVAGLLTALAIAIALTGVRIHRLVPVAEPGRMAYVIDESQSMPDAAQSRQGDIPSGGDEPSVTTIRFAGAVAPSEQSSKQPAADQRASSAGLVSETDIAQAVTAALARNADAIYLRTDGVETVGDAQVVAALHRQPWFVESLPQLPDMRIVDVETPPSPPHVPATARIRIESNVRADATFSATVGDDDTVASPLEVEPGTRDLWLQFDPHGRTAIPIDVKLSFPQDARPENNRYRSAWTASDPTTVLIQTVDTIDPTPIRDALAKRGWRVQVEADLPPTLSDRPDVAAVLLLGRRPDAESQTTLDDFVRQGGALVAVGGESLFAQGALEQSTWKEWLPVRPIEAAQQPPRESIAMVLVIDKSESMQYKDALKMAKEAARLTVGYLEPTDQVGVLAFGSQADWVSELAPAGDKQSLLQRIDALEVEGETNLHPAIERATLALAQAPAEHKHLILLTDGISAPGDFEAAAQRLNEAGVSVVTVSVTENAEQMMLKRIADIAGGEHFHSETAEELPRIFVRAAQQATEAIGPRRTRLFPLHASLDALQLNQAPELTGVIATKPADDATLLALGDEGEPVLASRNHGAGHVAVLICDPASLLEPTWRRWANNRLVEHLVRSLSPPSPPDLVQVRGRWADHQLEITVDIAEDGSWLEAETVTVEVNGTKAECPGVAPGRYAATIPMTADAEDRDPAQADVLVVLPNGRVLRRVWRGYRNYGDEFAAVGVQRRLLADLANQSGGAIVGGPDEIPAGIPADRHGPARRETTSLWIAAVLAAAGLVLVETWLRRHGLRYGADA